ncbi:hypothetical protein F5050DRAFT_505765 [Lentinula boryana]|uniref:Protein kinase domain-containing protein n=1 Tax=Lentinula boryana TaxID=40481 RepID=A0ABQ8QPB1_9AGAR|nr:hypothetical protein F5050DRAFT_505765 [Lentinula boryana]
MLFRSASLKLSIIVWISFFVIAGAVPLEISSELTSTKAGATQDCREMVLTASLKSKSTKGGTEHAAQEFAEEWCSQLEQHWIASSCVGYDKNQVVFLADRQLYVTNGINSLDFFTLPDHKHNRIKNRMAKIVNITERSTACERCALQSFHEYVRTGFAIIDEQKVGVIITSTGVNGASMRETTWWKDLTLNRKSYALNSTRKVVQEMVLDFLLEGKPLYANFSPDHVLIDDTKEVHLIDFGYPGVRPLRLHPNPDEYDKWFQRRWYFLWEDVYREAGVEIPIEHLWRKREPEQKGLTKMSLHTD